jgi:pyruvate kinase
MMDKIIRKVETMYPYLPEHPVRGVTESIASSAARISADLDADAIITFTRTGISAMQISRFRPPVPILAAVHDEKTLRRLSLVWGCVPLISVPLGASSEELVYDIICEGFKQGLLRENGWVIITSGFPFGKPGTTNTLKVLKVGDVLRSGIKG